MRSNSGLSGSLVGLVRPMAAPEVLMAASGSFKTVKDDDDAALPKRGTNPVTDPVRALTATAMHALVENFIIFSSAQGLFCEIRKKANGQSGRSTSEKTSGRRSSSKTNERCQGTSTALHHNHKHTTQFSPHTHTTKAIGAGRDKI